MGGSLDLVVQLAHPGEQRGPRDEHVLAVDPDVVAGGEDLQLAPGEPSVPWRVEDNSLCAEVLELLLAAVMLNKPLLLPLVLLGDKDHPQVPKVEILVTHHVEVILGHVAVLVGIVGDADDQQAPEEVGVPGHVRDNRPCAEVLGLLLTAVMLGRGSLITLRWPVKPIFLSPPPFY